MTTSTESSGGAVAVTRSSRLEFASVYRENAGRIAAFFGRRCCDPQLVADLTSQTFVRALGSTHTYQGRGSPTAWLIAIARRVWAAHLQEQTAGRKLVDQLGHRLALEDDEIGDLAERIDAQRRGRELLARAGRLSPAEREAVELVDMVGLTPKDAARVLGVSANALRVRLFRAHARLRKDHDS